MAARQRRNPPIPPEARLGLALMDAPDRIRLEARLARAASACGCDTGAVAMMIAMVNAVVWWIGYRDSELGLWLPMGLTVLGVLGAAIAGKVAGILVARAWLAFTVRRLRRRAGSTALA